MSHLEADIIKAWQKNGPQWINTIATDQIKSRKAATNQAIIKAVLHLNPKQFLDMGCGEGWLCRALAAQQIKCTGIDGVQELVDYANANGGGQFLLAAYEDLIHQKIKLPQQFDVITFNFALFGKDNTVDILKYTVAYLTENGRILIQTIHPENNLIERKEDSHWITENWKGFDAGFTPFNWYFRTQTEWEATFQLAGLQLSKTTSVLLKPNPDPFAVIYELTSL